MWPSNHEILSQGTSKLTILIFCSLRCIPDGGDVGYTMTELQPSPPGYRVQDEAPGPPSCPPGSYKYASHGHGSEAANFKSATSYSQEGYGLKQSPPRSVAPNEYYRRRNDGRRSSTENDHEGGNGGKKAAAVTSYNDGHKKNTPGYKNDCGYVLTITCALFFDVRSRNILFPLLFLPSFFLSFSLDLLPTRIIGKQWLSGV